MATAVRNAVRLLDLPLDEAARMASTYPAEFLRIDAERGSIAAGLRADLVELDDQLCVQQVWEGGKPQL
jgi:N-acetylglucosamine-6-phosphate deacetylase